MQLPEIVSILTAIYTIGSIVARITPTKRDDEIVGFFGKLVNLVGKYGDIVFTSSNQSKTKKLELAEKTKK